MRLLLPLVAVLLFSPKALAAGRGLLKVAPFSAPEEVAPLGAEVGRALGVALQALQVAPRAGEAEVIIRGSLELSGDKVRLSATCRGQSVHVGGDLEHLDDLLQQLAGKLRPVLEAPAPIPPLSASPVPAAPLPAQADKPAAPTKVSKPPATVEKAPPRKDPPRKPPPPPVSEPPSEPPRPDLSPPAAPVITAPPPVPDPRAPIEEVRLSVHIVGEPLGQLPAGLYGMGLSAQQAIVTSLQRHHLRAVPSRAVGLVGGREAVASAMRLGARYALMARFEALSVASSGQDDGSMTLSSRLHVVLLYDGRLRLDRVYPLPVIPLHPSEPAGSAGARAVGPVLDALASDLSAKMN